MNLESRINQLIKKASFNEQSDPETELDFSTMSDADLAKIAGVDTAEIEAMTTEQLRELINES